MTQRNMLSDVSGSQKLKIVACEPKVLRSEPDVDKIEMRFQEQTQQTPILVALNLSRF
jgi:hypothetical protein